MDILLALGVLLLTAMGVLLLAQDFVIRHVTSKPLGSLAPGYAATPRGFYTYAALVGNIGLILIALDSGNPWFLLLTIAGFVFASIVAIVGEFRTYRALKR